MWRVVGTSFCGVCLALTGCATLATVEQRTQRLIIAPEQVQSIREAIGAHPCDADQRATIVGAEARDGALHVVIACVGAVP